MPDYDSAIKEIQKILKAGTVNGMPLTEADRASLNRSIKALKQANEVPVSHGESDE
jgi:hypothetical protein